MAETLEDLKNKSVLWSLLVRFGMIPLMLGFYVVAVLHFDYTPDDTYIYLQYARHVADGSGFTFNEGMPSNGVTSPLWVLLISAGVVGGLDPFVVAKTLDLVFASLSLALVYVLGFGILKNRIYAFLAACLVGMDSWMLRWAGTGMETSLGVLLALLVFWYVYQGDYVLGSLACGLLTLVRPEGGLLFLVVLVDAMWLKRYVSAVWRTVLKSAAVYALVLMPWIIFTLVKFGSPVPNSFGAKSISPYSVDATLFVAGSEAKILISTQAVALLFLILGVVSSVRRRPWVLVRLEIFPLFWVGALLLFYVAGNVQVVSRYLLPALPFVALFGLWGMKKIEEFWKLEWRWTVALILLLVGGTAAQNAYVYGTAVLPHMGGFTRGMNECLKPMAYWLEQHAAPGSTVLTPDIGLLGYISNKRLFDTAGLVTPELKKAFAESSYEEGMMHRKYESVLRPDYVIDRSDQPERLAAADLRPVMTREFPSIAITKQGSVYYTLYEAVP